MLGHWKGRNGLPYYCFPVKKSCVSSSRPGFVELMSCQGSKPQLPRCMYELPCNQAGCLPSSDSLQYSEGQDASY